MANLYVKPVIKVHLLPNWSEKKLLAVFDELVAAVISQGELLGVVTEDDIIVLFPKDAMKKGLETEILVEVEVPIHRLTEKGADSIAPRIGMVLKKFLPKAHIQCIVRPFDSSLGFWATI